MLKAFKAYEGRNPVSWLKFGPTVGLRYVRLKSFDLGGIVERYLITLYTYLAHSI